MASTHYHPPLVSETLIPSESPRNTPILHARKPSQAYHLVQDLHLINEAVFPIYPMVTNTYALLSNIPPTNSHFTVLLFPDSYFYFAFTWLDPATWCAKQLTWTVLPQGFQDSSHFFGQALAQDLYSLNLDPNTLLQYIDDIMQPLFPSVPMGHLSAPKLSWLHGTPVSPSQAQLPLYT